GPPARCVGHQADDDSGACAPGAWQALRSSDHVRRRRPGQRDDSRAAGMSPAVAYFLRRMYVTWVTPVILPSLSIRMYSLLMVLLSSDNVLITTCCRTPLRLLLMRIL